MKRVIEVTGVAGVGKSHIIDKLIKKRDNILLDTEIVQRYNLTDSYMFYLFFKVDNSFRILILILKIAYELNMRFYDKINFIRNSIKKVAKDYFLRDIYSENRIVLVDEGISHLYQNIVGVKKQNDLYILLLVDKLISNLTFSNEILIVNASSQTVIKRLYERGHERLNSLEEITTFVQKSRQNLSKMKKKFSNIMQIFNEDKIKSGNSHV